MCSVVNVNGVDGWMEVETVLAMLLFRICRAQIQTFRVLRFQATANRHRLDSVVANVRIVDILL